MNLGELTDAVVVGGSVTQFVVSLTEITATTEHGIVAIQDAFTLNV